MSGRVSNIRWAQRYRLPVPNITFRSHFTPTGERGGLRRDVHTKMSPATSIGAFSLRGDFVAGYASKPAPFGFNGLGELVYQRTYARPLPDGSGFEQWHQTVERVVNGTYNMQLEWMQKSNLPWDSARYMQEAENMYDRIFNLKFLPPGRGLWAMGSPLTTSNRRIYAALNNCAFVSTIDLAADVASPFCFLMDASMLGVGVGFDTKGANTVLVHTRAKESETEVFQIPDSREGWVESLRILLHAFLSSPETDTSSPSAHRTYPRFDYSLIRPKGSPIKGFGGTSQGPGPLIQLHKDLIEIFTSQHSAHTIDSNGLRSITITDIVDIMNLVGKCVVSGNVRRTAEIAFGDPHSDEYVSLKDFKANPRRESFGWTSNNSVFAELGMDYSKICERVAINGEPGFSWLENMRSFSRMGEGPDYKDIRAAGGNPCLEQTLENKELCCLVETFPNRHESLDDYCETLRLAFIYAKTVTLGQTHWPETNAIMLRNRRIGASMSGIAQFIAKQGIHRFKEWCEEGYEAVQATDAAISDRFAIPRSIKTTSIKPSGTVSLLAGATPGMHFPESRFYIRRVRIDAGSELLPDLIASGYKVEPAATDPEHTRVVEIPVDCGEGVRTLDDVSMWEQLSLAAFLQKYWADNQVSSTVSFDPKREGRDLPHALAYFQYQLKGISFLPRLPAGAYAQMPYEAITEAQYNEASRNLKPFHLLRRRTAPGPAAAVPEIPDKFCESDTCVAP